MKLAKKVSQRLDRLFSKYNRNLLKELVWVDFKTYDHGSVLGVLWSLLNPLLTLLVMYCVFEYRLGRHVRFYPLYLLIGIIMVNFFINVTSRAIKSIPINRDIILNSTVIPENFILADIFVGTYKFIIELMLCWGISVYYGLFTWGSFLLIVPLFIAYIAIVSGAAFIMALLHCFTADIEHIWRIVSRILLFITPVFYKLNDITPFFRKLIYWANPISPFLMAFRRLIIGDGSSGTANYLYCFFLGGISLILGYFIFLSFETRAVERI